MALSWNEQAGRFTDTGGRFISDRAVRSVVDHLADGASTRMASAAERMLAAEISLAEFQSEAMRTIKLSQLAASTIAHGGQARMGFSEYGAAGRAIRDQYAYLRSWAQGMADGSIPLNDGAIVARARQYGQQARVAFEREYGRGQMARGYTSCRNVLHAGESCSQCRAETARGWVSIGTLVPVGSRICRANCKCTVTYRKDAALAA